MSLTTIMNTATSGLMTAQTQLRVISDNVSNVNTPGYIRKVVDQNPLVTAGVGAGVEAGRIRLATDRFLQAAALNANGDAARQGVRAEMMDRIQDLFGDPSGDTSVFAQVDQMFAAFSAITDDATSGPRRQDAVFKAQQLFDEAARVHAGIQAVRQDADSRLVTAVDTINGLLKDIESLNVEISRATVVGNDSSGAESAQAQLIDQLSQFMDVRVSARTAGGVNLRTGDGMVLVGDGAATLSYQRAGNINAETTFDQIWLTEPRGEKRQLSDHLTSGELKGLIELRDVEAPAADERLGELMTRLADELNRAHNAGTSVPPPTSLTGRNTGLDLPTAVTGFTGRTEIAIMDASGKVVRRVDVDFSAGTMSTNGGPASAFTPGSFLADLNASLGADGSASFVNGALTLTANGSGNGVAIADDPAAKSDKAGRGFSHYFGLNDLVRSDGIALYETGLTPASSHGFTPGDTITFRFSNENGARLKDLKVAIPPGGTMQDLLNQLNSPSAGVGQYGTFSLDSLGRMSFTPNTNPAASMALIEDKTSRAGSGVGFAELFGIGAGARASRADGFSIRTDVRNDPTKLALAQLDFSAAVGAAGAARGDGRNTQKLADAGSNATWFESAGGAAGSTVSVTRYMAEFAGDLGGKAALASQRKDAAETLAREAETRRSGIEGVNLDEELVKLTVFQQAYAASGRLIQAAKDMYDVLLGML
ncbi:flagellar hook-associated protein FlgK [Caulobacter sp. 17J80-11]|uniref:flagellar hook-associated protein FlgK n=1 Tax=Caulobacter sp. 17J80-11 TaxID=2763502 RepID=UPI0016536315|nr:flagellar hook-associated protein FlgK [Caulobacter sp. 17J80-11]MBC6982628.1 flagellar hook-associated protein FlgK [Caulobacter sp. 17J80-11]